MNGTPKRRFPKVLADELSAALFAVSDLGHEAFMELLARYRRNRAKRIAVWGLLNNGAPVDGLEFIPLEQIRNIERLDEAFQKLHNYSDGGAGDYVAADVEKVINSFRAQGPRKRSHDYGEICMWLSRREYRSSDNKKALVAEAADFFSTSESTIFRALREGGLVRAKRSTAT